MNVVNYDREITYLNHTITEMEYLIHFKGRIVNSLSDDEVRGIPRAFEIIGEACRRLPVEFTQNYDKIKWHKLIGLRNIIAHQYDKLDMFVLLNAINTQIEIDLSLLKTLLQELS